MLTYDAFSALTLARVFPAAHLGDYPYYVAVDPAGNFDTEYLGGQWHEELVDAVQFFFPAADGTKLGVVELWAAGCVVAAAVRDKMALRSTALVPAWAANADRVLAALDLTVRMGSPEADVRALAAAAVRVADYPAGWYPHTDGVEPGTVRSLTFAIKTPDVYHVGAVVHVSAGLLSLRIVRPDLVRENDRDEAYDAFFAPLHDEG